MNNNIVEFLNSKDKVELSSQVVELGVIEDIKAIESKTAQLKALMQTIENKVMSMSSEIKKQLNDYDKLYKDSISIEKQSESKYNEFKSKAADLGLDIKGSEAFKYNESILKMLLQIAPTTELRNSAKTFIG